jgi:hypothetical protein
MEFDWNKFISSYQAAPDEVKSLIDSSFLADCTKQLIDMGSVESKHHQILIVALSHYLLKSTPENEIVKILESHGITNTLSLIGKVIRCLESKKDNGQGIKKNQELQSEIKEAERELEEVQTIRTMASDMRHIQETQPITIHQSSQDDLIRPMSTVPPPAPPTGPQWETDSHS